MSNNIPKQPLEFTVDLLRDVLYLAITDTDYLKSIRPIFGTEYFKSGIHKIISVAIIEHFDKYRNCPGKVVIRKCVRDHYINLPDNAEDMLDLAVTELQLILKQRYIADKAYYLDEWERAARHQAYNNAVEEIAYNVGQDNHEGAIQILQQANQVKLNVGLGTSIFENIWKRISDRAQFMDNEVISTFIPHVDGDLRGGMWGGRLGVIVAKPNHGKTTLLVHLGRVALVQNFPVIHYTLEESELDIAEKYEVAMSNLTYSELTDALLEYSSPQESGKVGERECDLVLQKHIDTIENYQKITSSDLMVKYYNRKTINMNEIRRHLDQLKVNGFFKSRAQRHTKGLVILDYPDLVLPIKQKTDNWENVSNVYIEFHTMLAEYGLGGWVASHIKIPSSDKDLLEMEDLGKAGDKSAFADIVITINQNKEERAADPEKVRLNMAKVRGGKARRVYELTTGLKQGQFIDPGIYARKDNKEVQVKDVTNKVDNKSKPKKKGKKPQPKVTRQPVRTPVKRIIKRTPVK